MIDVEYDVYDAVVSAINDYAQGADLNIMCSSEYVNMPTQMPLVTIIESDNRVTQRYRSNEWSNGETAATVMYEVQIYTNAVGKKRSQAKKIASVVDLAFASLGFSRMMKSQVQNLSDTTIYRLVMRYQGVIVENDDGKYYIYNN